MKNNYNANQRLHANIFLFKQKLRFPIRFFNKLLLLFLLLISFGVCLNAQDSIPVSTLQKDTSSVVWHQFKQLGPVILFYQYVDCGPVSYIQIKAENTSNSIVSISWEYSFFYNGTPLALSPDDLLVSLNINPGTTISGVCDSPQFEKLKIFISESGMPSRVTLIALTNISVNNI